MAGPALKLNNLVMVWHPLLQFKTKSDDFPQFLCGEDSQFLVIAQCVKKQP